MKNKYIVIPWALIIIILIYQVVTHIKPNMLGFGIKPIHIAVVGPMSGPDKENGQAMVKGVRLYIDELNNAGGVYGRKVKLRIFDDRNQRRRHSPAADNRPVRRDTQRSAKCLSSDHSQSSPGFFPGELGAAHESAQW